MQVEVGGNEYRIGKVPALEQFHIVRRLAPALGKLMALSAELQKDRKKPAEPEAKPAEGAAEEAPLDARIRAVSVLGDTLAEFSDEESERILFGILAGVRRKEPKGLGWSPVIGAGQLMYDDIEFLHLLTLAVYGMRENFADFFDALRSIFDAESQTASAPSNG